MVRILEDVEKQEPDTAIVVTDEDNDNIYQYNQVIKRITRPESTLSSEN